MKAYWFKYILLIGLIHSLVGCHKNSPPVNGTSILTVAEQTQLTDMARQYTLFYLRGNIDGVIKMQSRIIIEENAKAYRTQRRVISIKSRYAKARYGKTILPSSFVVISFPRNYMRLCLFYSLNNKWREQLIYGTWPDWSQPDLAVVQFKLKGKRYIQIWHKEGGTWLCLIDPLDGDEESLKAVTEAPDIDQYLAK